eukprot:m.711753 g.711753  ORF g.711753 m.711753 type:complete len:739 (+) comp22954_c0_seq2:141-2357(+)
MGDFNMDMRSILPLLILCATPMFGKTGTSQTKSNVRWTAQALYNAAADADPAQVMPFLEDHLELERRYFALAAEKTELLAEVNALQLQVTMSALAQENKSLRKQLSDILGEDHESLRPDQNLGAGTDACSVPPQSIDIDEVQCEQLGIQSTPSCVGKHVQRASFSMVEKCKTDLCNAMEKWAIADMTDGHIVGQGYGCKVSTASNENSGESVCFYADGPAPPIARKALSATLSSSIGAQISTPSPVPDAGPPATEWSSSDLDDKKEFVKGMMVHAWKGYKDHAWGKNELSPRSRKGLAGGLFGKDMGSTIVDSLDTLHIMGMTEELGEARAWVESSLNFNSNENVSVFEAVIRFLGGLLSAFALTRDEMYLTKAEELADRLMPAFDTPTGVPWAQINLQTGKGSTWSWAPKGMAILSELGTVQLEMEFLSDVTGNDKYRKAATNTIDAILNKAARPSDGLFSNYFDPLTGSWGQRDTSLGPYGDSFYEYLLKIWVYHGGHRTKDQKASVVRFGQNMTSMRETYDTTMHAVRTHLHAKAPHPHSETMFVSDYKSGKQTPVMWHLACFAGGMYALSGVTAPNASLAAAYRDDAASVTQTCRDMYSSQPTGLGPESAEFTSGGHKIKDSRYILRPETVESYFYLWRTTHDPKYRDWAWEAVLAIQKHCKCGSGYCGIKDVTAVPVVQDDVMQSFFLAETLKYLYLIFTDDSVFPLTEWVFNTEAHPLPVRNGMSWEQRWAT